MNRILINSIIILGIIAITTNLTGCSGCVKKASQKATEISLDAAEGVLEAVEKKGASIGEKTGDAAGSILTGLGKSLSKQLEDNASEITKTGSKIIINSAEGLMDGLEEIKINYDTLSYSTKNIPEDMNLKFVGKQKHTRIIDSYLIIPEAGYYDYELIGYDVDDKIILSKKLTIHKDAEDKRHETLVSFGIDEQTNRDYKNIERLVANIEAAKN